MLTIRNFSFFEVGAEDATAAGAAEDVGLVIKLKLPVGAGADAGAGAGLGAGAGAGADPLELPRMASRLFK